MPGLPEAIANVSPQLTAAVLLLSRALAEPLGLAAPGVNEILATTGVSRSRAYELCGELATLLPSLQRPAGRPARAPSEPPSTSSQTEAVTRAVLGFAMERPGCVHAGRNRIRYSDCFRHFVLELREQHATLELEHLAAAVNVPLGTLKDWLHTPSLSTAATPVQPNDSPAPAPKGSNVTAHIQTVVTAWQSWSGSFVDFCDYVQRYCRVPIGRTAIATILEAHGVRLPRRRPGRTADEKSLQHAFRTFFPGAQWEGDGTDFTIVLDQVRFGFNLELMVDSASGAFVGLSLRDTEDSQAVVEAFADGVTTTGQPPLATVLDNRGSNHTPEVEAALGETLLIRATPARGQNKPHVEGGFGLFAQTVPAVVLNTQRGPRELARQLAVIVALVFCRLMNHRPRFDRGGRSRVDLYGEQPTPEQIQAALAELKELQRKQLLAQQTAQARLRPEVLALLEEAFRRLSLDDPTGNCRKAIAYYPLDDILAGLAVFEAKQQTGSLPLKPNFDPARYLLGIVRNIAQQREGLLIAELLLRRRLAQQDIWLAGIRRARDLISSAQSDPAALVPCFLDRALHSQPGVDRLFWLTSTVDVVLGANGARDALLQLAARHINATHDVPYRERLAAFRFIAERAVPLT